VIRRAQSNKRMQWSAANELLIVTLMICAAPADARR
jgi:hypothetical protein